MREIIHSNFQCNSNFWSERGMHEAQHIFSKIRRMQQRNGL